MTTASHWYSGRPKSGANGNPPRETATEKAVIVGSRNLNLAMSTRSQTTNPNPNVKLRSEHMTFLRNLWNDEQGQDLIEYTLLMAFVALASAALFIGAGGSIKG